MIDFSLEPELELLRETAARFASDHFRVGLREHEQNRALGDPAIRLWESTGLGRLEFPESLDGTELGCLARVLVNEELGAADPGAALALDGCGMGLYVAGSPPANWFRDALDNAERVVVVCDLSNRLGVGGESLSGNLPWVPADNPTRLAILGRDGVAVTGDQLHAEPVRGSGLRAAGGATIKLENAEITSHWNNPAEAARALSRIRLYIASLLVGVMREAYEYSRDYAVERVVFGRPVAHHQAVAFTIADMAMAVDACRLLVHEAAWKLDSSSDDAPRCAARAFVEAAEQAMFVTPSALQLLGGHGFMQDHPVEKYMREARTLSLMAGGVDAAREDAFAAPKEAPLAMGGK